MICCDPDLCTSTLYAVRKPVCQHRIFGMVGEIRGDRCSNLGQSRVSPMAHLLRFGCFRLDFVENVVGPSHPEWLVVTLKNRRKRVNECCPALRECCSTSNYRRHISLTNREFLSRIRPVEPNSAKHARITARLSYCGEHSGGIRQNQDPLFELEVGTQHVLLGQYYHRARTLAS